LNWDGCPRRIEREAAAGAASKPILEGSPKVRPDGGGGERMATYEAYCVKCKAKRQFEGEEVTMKNGMKAAKGKCPVCGTTVMRILGKA
jgi:Domain of unknown function (DUF5679)